MACRTRFCRELLRGAELGIWRRPCHQSGDTPGHHYNFNLSPGLLPRPDAWSQPLNRVPSQLGYKFQTLTNHLLYKLVSIVLNRSANITFCPSSGYSHFKRPRQISLLTQRIALKVEYWTDLTRQLLKRNYSAICLSLCVADPMYFQPLCIEKSDDTALVRKWDSRYNLHGAIGVDTNPRR